MVKVTDDILIDNSELDISFIRASGPGGQHVNKSATAVQLRFDVASSPSLPAPVRRRLLHLSGSQITKDGELIINASQHRSQHRNRQEALQRLKALVRRAAQRPKRRRETRVPQRAKEQRLDQKQRRSETKRLRKPPRRW